jgi:hypothetical protein
MNIPAGGISMSEKKSFWSNWWLWIIVGVIVVIFKDTSLNGGGGASAKPRTPAFTDTKSVSIEQKGHRLVAIPPFKKGGSRTLVVKVASLNGKTVDYILVPSETGIINAAMHDLNPDRSKILLRGDNILESEDSFEIHPNKLYTLILRHGDFSKSLFADKKSPVAVKYQVTIY